MTPMTPDEIITMAATNAIESINFLMRELKETRFQNLKCEAKIHDSYSIIQTLEEQLSENKKTLIEKDKTIDSLGKRISELQEMLRSSEELLDENNSITTHSEEDLKDMLNLNEELLCENLKLMSSSTSSTKDTTKGSKKTNDFRRKNVKFSGIKEIVQRCKS